MEENFLVKANRFLQKAIEELDQGKIDSAIVSIATARRILVESFPSTSTGLNAYEVLHRIIYFTKCVMLHYKALAKKEQENDSLHLAYLGHALGISTILDTSLIPLMRKYSEADRDKKEVAWFSRQNRAIGDNLRRSICHLIDKMEGQSGGKARESLDLSITKITDAVDRNAKSVRKLAVRLGMRFSAGDFKQARKIYEFVRDEIQYVRDPLEFEEIQSPATTLKLRAGDCEDQAILLCSLLSAIGFESALIFADTDNDKVPDHVYSAVYIPSAPDYCKPLVHQELEDGKDLNDWIPLDPTSEDADFGVIPIGDFQIIKFIPVSQK